MAGAPKTHRGVGSSVVRCGQRSLHRPYIAHKSERRWLPTNGVPGRTVTEFYMDNTANGVQAQQPQPDANPAPITGIKALVTSDRAVAALETIGCKAKNFYKNASAPQQAQWAMHGFDRQRLGEYLDGDFALIWASDGADDRFCAECLYGNFATSDELPGASVITEYTDEETEAGIADPADHDLERLAEIVELAIEDAQEEIERRRGELENFAKLRAEKEAAAAIKNNPNSLEARAAGKDVRTAEAAQLAIEISERLADDGKPMLVYDEGSGDFGASIKGHCYHCGQAGVWHLGLHQGRDDGDAQGVRFDLPARAGRLRAVAGQHH